MNSIRVDDLMSHEKAVELVKRLNAYDDRKWLLRIEYPYSNQMANTAMLQNASAYQSVRNPNA